MSVPALHVIIPGALTQNTGGYRFDRRVVEGLRGRGWDVQVHELPGRYPDVDAAAILAGGITLSRVPDQAVVLIDGLAIPGLAAAMNLERRRLRLVALVHHPLWLEPGYGATKAMALRSLEQGALACARRILVPSRTTVRDVIGMGIPEAMIAVIPPGTDPAPRAVGGPDGVVTLLSVGILTPRKGQLAVLDALADLVDLPWRLILVGGERDTAYAATLRAAIKRFGMAERVAMLGDVDEAALATAFAQADLFVQASQHEGYGMALTEALAHGLPVVATAVGVAAEMIGEGGGLLVPPNDAPALADALRRILSDTGLRHRLRDEARSAATRLPAWDSCIDRFSEELKKESETV